MKWTNLVIILLCGILIVKGDNPRKTIEQGIDSINFALYPLQIGNLWEYWEDNTYTGQTKATTDTLLNNGLKYTKLSGSIISGYYRQEGSKVFRFNQQFMEDELLFDFSKTQGDTVSVIYRNEVTITTTLKFVIEQEVFGKMLKQWKFFREFNPTTYYESYIVVDSIGIVSLDVEPAQQWYLKGAIIDGNKYGAVTKVVNRKDIENYTSQLFSFPNPFNSSINIQFTLPKTGKISLKIFNSVGAEIVNIYDGELDWGEHSFYWNAKDGRNNSVASGIYFCVLSSSNSKLTNKILLIK